jgi:hypothetical protein
MHLPLTTASPLFMEADSNAQDKSYDSSSSNGGSDKENDTKRNNISTLFEDDTEGGLHLPLGSTSPIMRKLHHQTACSLAGIRPPPLDLGGSNSKHNESNLSPKNNLQVITQSPTTESKVPATSTTAAAKSQKPKHTSKQIHAIKQWQTTCREQEAHSYEEAHQNIRAVLIQRRKQHSAAIKNGSCSRPRPSTTDKEHDKVLKQLDHVDEMLELASKHRLWYQLDGKLVVFETIPHLSLQGVVTHPVLNQDEDEVTLAPGTIIHATELIVLDSRTLRQVNPTTLHCGKSNNDDREAKGQQQYKGADTIQLLKITSPHVGYIVSHLHDYPYVAPGTPLDYVPNYQQSTSDAIEPIQWMWRVVYQPDGAFVRNGAELISDQIGTLPYGSFCNVQEKIINEMGLSRLKVQACVKETIDSDEEKKDEERTEKNEDGGWKEITGWTSLFINPLSGNSGHIVEPINFPVPA